MARSTLFFALCFAAACPSASAASRDKSTVTANPIRKVVNLLQGMQAKVEAEGKKEKDLFDKFMCYCKTGAGDLEKSIEAAGVKVPSVASDIEESEAQLAQTKDELKSAQTDRSAAKTAMESATGIREKEAAAYASQKADYEATLSAIAKAVAALEKGMAGSFLQTPAAKVLQKLALGKQDLQESDRDGLLSFLAGSSSSKDGYAPSSGEVTGILKQMGDEMSAGLKDATATEKSAIATYDDLMAAKKKEVEALTAAIEAKTVKIGDLGVAIVQMKNDMSDTEAQLVEDKKLLAELSSTCKTKEAEWTVIVQTRADELVAIAETIKILNDDDALELFKKTLPSAGSSFVQLATNTGSLRMRALTALEAAGKAAARRPGHGNRARIDLIALALRGRTADFSKVIALIDEMVKLLKGEQADDDNKKEFCLLSLDTADDKKKALEAGVADAEAAIATIEEGIATVKDEISALEAGIKALDKSVVEATEQRQEEHSDYTELQASDTAAKELLGFAKNRLNKFYNPKLYKAPPKRVLSAEDTIVTSMGGTLAPTAPPGGIAGTGISLVEVSAHRQMAAQPEAPGPYAKKTEDSTGVIAMIDLLIKDLDKELTESETAEKEAQKEYEEMMVDSASKRATDSTTLTQKESTKAALEADLEATKEKKSSTTKELMATLEYIASLHSECDWLLKYFDVRKEARFGEIDALKKAKDVLNGADYSFIQRGALRGSMQ